MRDLRTEDEIVRCWKAGVDQLVVSICCFTYNHEAYIEDALEGFLRQITDFPIEVIIHDDASTDRTTEIIHEYKLRYPRIINPILQLYNQHSKGRKILPIPVESAEGTFVAFCDGDDYWLSEDKLSKQVAYMKQNPDCVGTFHGATYLIDGNFTGLIFPPPPYNCLNQKNIILRHHIATCSTLYRTKILKEAIQNCKSFEKFIVGDIPASILMAGHGYICFLDEIRGVYRKNYASLTHNKKYLRSARIRLIKTFFLLIPYVEKRNRIFVVYVMMRLFLGFFKFWRYFTR